MEVGALVARPAVAGAVGVVPLAVGVVVGAVVVEALVVGALVGNGEGSDSHSLGSVRLSSRLYLDLRCHTCDNAWYAPIFFQSSCHF